MTSPVPPPADEREAALDALVRRKMERGETLTPDERAYLATRPGARENPTSAQRDPSRVHGNRT